MDKRFSFQFITHFTESIGYLDSALMALRGGCRWIQLRMKNANAEEIIPVAARIRKACNDYGAVFIIDDHVELVETIQADGVHLGKNDMSVSQARTILGPGKIIGGTANTIEDVISHYRQGADYVGCGPFRFTTTKEKLSPTLGIHGYSSIISQMQQQKIRIPIVAIGGITDVDIPQILNLGIDGIAMSGSILRSADPVSETKRFTRIIEDSKNK